MEFDRSTRHIPADALAPGPRLFPWDVGAAVAEVQELLCAHGFKLAIDGDFSWKTETAVKLYQKQHKLRIDGIVGRETWISLKTTVKPGTRLLKETHSGADVYELQGLLQIQGYSLKRDGIFGAETKSAVIDFQRHHQLSGNGVVNPVTWSLLAEKVTALQRRRKKT
jgi:peptidoglycan hydrolase-like protein with peptidoglycan-binding domain